MLQKSRPPFARGASGFGAASHRVTSAAESARQVRAEGETRSSTACNVPAGSGENRQQRNFRRTGNGTGLNTIRSLDANKTYYIANSTGEIKEAGTWQKFKCFFGVGDGRDKVQKLACHGEGTRGNYLGLFDDTLLLSGSVLFDGGRGITAR